MPRRTRKPARRRRRRKMPLLRSPVPLKMFTKMRYSQEVDLAFEIGTGKTLGGLSTETDYVFRANGLYKPDEFNAIGINGSHQPRGFDQLMLLYDHYTVVGAKITARITNASSTAPAGQPITLGIVLADNNSRITKFTDLLEQGKVRTSTVAHPEGGRGLATLSQNFSAKRFFSRPNVLDNGDLRGSVAANPLEGAFFHIVASIGALSTLRVITAAVTIDFIVALTEPKQPLES